MSPHQSIQAVHFASSNFETRHHLTRKQNSQNIQNPCGHSSQLQNQTLFECSQPCSAHMTKFQPRIMTFLRNWPNHIKASPKHIAEAGFFYLGESDRVKCFYCNGGLQHWSHNDDPWFEHAKWYPHCEFVLKSKGMEYVTSVASQYPDIKRPFDAPKQSRTSCDTLQAVAKQARVQTVCSNEAESQQTLLSRALQTEIVKESFCFGFEESAVKAVVRFKLESDGSEYSSLMELVSAIQAFTEAQTSNEEMDQDPFENPTQDFDETSQKSGLVAINESKNLVYGNEANSPQIGEDSKRQVEEIKQEQMCKICLDANSDCVLMGCGHICCCSVCAPALRSCPICRTKIDKIVKFYRQ